MSQQSLANRLGVTPQTIRRWENGHEPRRDLLPVIEEELSGAGPEPKAIHERSRTAFLVDRDEFFATCLKRYQDGAPVPDAVLEVMANYYGASAVAFSDRQDPGASPRNAIRNAPRNESCSNDVDDSYLPTSEGRSSGSQEARQNVDELKIKFALSEQRNSDLVQQKENLAAFLEHVLMGIPMLVGGSEVSMDKLTRIISPNRPDL